MADGGRDAGAKRLDARTLRVRVLDALVGVAGPGVKRGILNRTAQRIAAAILRARTSSTDPVHFGTLAAVHGANDLDNPLAREAVLAVGRYVLRGRVIPVQRVHELLDEARVVYLARCPCRASGRVQDRPGRPEAAAAEPELPRAEAERLLDAIERAWERPEVPAATSARAAEAFDRVVSARRAGAPGGTLHDLFVATWPYWEILLDHPGYDRAWLLGLAANGKVWETARPLAHAWVDALYRGRGVIYTRMEAAGLPYAVCSCPGPEVDGGCMLTNWHYFSGNDEILHPNEAGGFGRRRDAAGNVLPCRKHAAREARGCLGCGCDHAEE